MISGESQVDEGNLVPLSGVIQDVFSSGLILCVRAQRHGLAEIYSSPR